MSWIPKKNATTSAPIAVATAPAPAVHRPSHAHSLEMPVVLSVRRLPAPVYGTLMEITAHGAKIRSLVLMERGTEVEFDLGIGSGTPLTINGRVEARRNAPTGARFEYHVVFANMRNRRLMRLRATFANSNAAPQPRVRFKSRSTRCRRRIANAAAAIARSPRLR